MALQGVQREAQAAQRTTVDVLNALQDLTNPRARLILAQRDRVIASYTLLGAVGRLDVKTLALNTPDYLPEFTTTRSGMPGMACGRRQDNELADISPGRATLACRDQKSADGYGASRTSKKVDFCGGRSRAAATCAMSIRKGASRSICFCAPEAEGLFLAHSARCSNVSEVPKMTKRRLLLASLAVLTAATAGSVGWRELHRSPYPEWVAMSNGRLEAERIDITSKLPARLIEVLVDEGQMVDKGAVLVRLDAAEIEAQLRAGEAQVRRAEQAIDEAQHVVVLRESLRTLAKQEFDRTSSLVPKQAASVETLDQRRAALDAAEAAYQQGISSHGQAEAVLEAAQADVARLRSVLSDTVLTAPRRGRVQYKLMQAGEVAAAGSRILTLLDLADVYMTGFLSASAAAQLALGDEARLILDPIPQYVVPAHVSFVAAEAQFTPKSVETSEEREKLMFRVKLKIAPDLLKKFESQVKTGVRGVGFVRTHRDAPWPASLETKLPQ